MITTESTAVIAVGEHFLAEEYCARTANLHPMMGEGDELSLTKDIMSDASMRARSLTYRCAWQR